MKITHTNYNTIQVIKKPKITEKSGIKAESQNVYTFEVLKNATKHSVAAAIQEMYKVTPIKVNMVSLPAKAVFSRGKNGKRGAIKKALVFLKKGDKIAFI